MTDYGAGAPSDFARSTRMPLDAVVRLHFEGTVAFQNGFAANVSATGMFVKHPEPPPIGTRLVFEFTVGSARKPVQGTGEVVWLRDKYDGPGRPAGAGIRFVDLDELSKQAITEALFEFLEMSLGDRVIEHPEVRAMVASRPTVAPLDPLTPAEQPLQLPSIDGLATQKMPAFRPEEQETLSMPAFRPAEPEPAVTGGAPTPFRIFDDEPAETAPAAPEPAPPTWTPPAWEPPSLSVPPEAPAPANWGAVSGEPPRLAGAARASDAPTSRGPWPWIAAAIVVAAAAAGGWWYFLRPRPVEPPAAAPPTAVAEPAPAPEPTSPPLDPAPGPGTTLVEAVGTSTPAPAVPLPATPPPATAAPEPAPAAPEPAPVAAEPAPAAASARPATTVTAISGAAVDGGSTVTIAGDGGFPTGRFSWSEIGGDKPRVLIKLKGISSPYRGAAPGSTAEVAGVRTGFHQLTGGPELHVVLDLVAGARVVVDAVEPAGDALIVRLSRR
jgi:uncharacterized protein (TIGR02266 family)